MMKAFVSEGSTLLHARPVYYRLHWLASSSSISISRPASYFTANACPSLPGFPLNSAVVVPTRLLFLYLHAAKRSEKANLITGVLYYRSLVLLLARVVLVVVFSCYFY